VDLVLQVGLVDAHRVHEVDDLSGLADGSSQRLLDCESRQVGAPLPEFLDDHLDVLDPGVIRTREPQRLDPGVPD